MSKLSSIIQKAAILLLFCNFKIINLDKVFLDSFKPDNDLGNGLSRDEVLKILSKHSKFTKLYLNVSLKDPLAIKNILKHLNNPYQIKIFQESKTKFGDLSDIETQLDLALKKIQKYFINYKVPDIYIFSCGLANDIYYDKDIIVVDLSYFFGKDSKYLPSMPVYMLPQYNARSIIPKIINKIATQLGEYDHNDQALVADMVYHGRIYFFTKNILTSYSYEEIIGYTQKDIEFIKKNKAFIWNYFIKNQLLYNKIKDVKSTFIDEAPYTLDFGGGSPGKIGRWFGIEIIESFYKKNKSEFSIVEKDGPFISKWLTRFKNRGVDLKKIMNMRDMRFIFINSGYTQYI